MAPAKSMNAKDLLSGGVLQCVEAATLGLPFEVWKTHMGTYRSQGFLESFRNIYAAGGAKAFWSGLSPKMVESFFKGGLLLFSKEAIMRSCQSMGFSSVTSGLIGGFGGGVTQVVIIGPCTYLVTAAVTGDKSISMMQRLSQTYKKSGISGFYTGGTALIFRQGTNWASRQGITDFFRSLIREKKDNPKEKLTIFEESLAAVCGGSLSTWNQPFEVIRIEAQASAAKGLPPKGMFQTAKHIMQESGLQGLFRGISPRVGLCIWQTYFMVTIPYILKPYGLM